MGEMTIRMDEALRIELEERARRLGTEPSELISDLLRSEFEAGSRAGVGSAGRQPEIDKVAWDELEAALPSAARVLKRSERFSPLSAVDLLDQIRDEGR